jgi:hypothetical protein
MCEEEPKFTPMRTKYKTTQFVHRENEEWDTWSYRCDPEDADYILAEVRWDSAARSYLLISMEERESFTMLELSDIQDFCAQLLEERVYRERP